MVEAGDPRAAPVLFLHGWPEAWHTWGPVMALAARRARAIAIDLPGIGGSTGEVTGGRKRQLAATVHELVTRMSLIELTLVGHDIGGMVAYSYLREFGNPARLVIVDVAVPGVAPWEHVLRNPHIWHFGFHAVPERLVRGRQREYFDYFYDALTEEPAAITEETCAASATAYATDDALTSGFNWYRSFSQDAADNTEYSEKESVPTPVLYVRGERDRDRIGAYLLRLEAAGLTRLEHSLISDSGHFVQRESPEQLWQAIANFGDL